MLKVCLVHFPLGQTKSCLAGYPPPDDDLRNFLTACSIKVPVDGKNDEFTEFKDPECRVGYFLVELFKKTAEMVKVEGMGNDKASRIRKFREFMSKDQSMDSAGAGRLMFYQDVIRRANKVSCRVSFPSAFSYSYFRRAYKSLVISLQIASNYQEH